MRVETVEREIFSFGELTESAKENAAILYSEWLNGDEFVDSLKGFCEHFNIELQDYSIGGSWDRNNKIVISCHDIEVSGVRLWKYLANNGYFEYINSYTKEKGNLLAGDCPFTGVCYDETLLDPLREFMEKPDSRDFGELMQDCVESLLRAAIEDYDYSHTAECLEELAEGNQWEFTKDGMLA